MKKTLLFFTALVLTGTAAFAWQTCGERILNGGSVLPHCEKALLSFEGYTPDDLKNKCCWNNAFCADVGSEWPTCESLIEQGQAQTVAYNGACCWASNPPTVPSKGATNTGNGKGDKKTHVQAPKGKQGAKVQPVKANTAKAPAQAKVQVQKKTVTKK